MPNEEGGVGCELGRQKIRKEQTANLKLPACLSCHVGISNPHEASPEK